MTKNILYCNCLFIQTIVIIFLSTASYFSVYSKSFEIENVNFIICGIDATRIANFTMLFCIFLNTLFNRNIKKTKDGMLLFLVSSVVAFYIFSTLISFSGIQDLHAIIGFIIVVLYFYSLISAVNITLRTEFILKSLYYLGIISAVFALHLSYAENLFGFYQPSIYYRLVGWYGNPNILATVLALAVIISYCFWYTHRGLIFALSTYFLIAVLLLTGNKTTSIILLAIFLLQILYLFLKNYRLRISRCIVYIIFFTLSFSGILIIAQTLGFFSYDFVIFDAFSDMENIKTISSRIDIWSEYVVIYRDSTIIDQLMGKGRLYLTGGTELGKSAHSFYIRYLIEHGSIFLFFMILLIIYILIKLFVLAKRSKDNSYQILFIIVFFLAIRSFTTPELLSARVGNFAFMMILAHLLLLPRITIHRGISYQ